MKKRIVLIPVILLLAMSLTAMGCPPVPEEVVQPAPAPVDPLEEAIVPMALSIGTGGVGGIAFPYGGGVAEIITDHVPGLTATAEVTGAAVANVRLVNAGEVKIGHASTCVAYTAFHGIGVFEGEEMPALRALFYLYPSFFYLVTLADSGIYSIADIVGRRISTGAPGSGTEVITVKVLTALGYSLDDFIVSRLSFAENVTALRDGVIDVGAWVAGLPVASIIDIATTHDIRIIPLSPEEQAKVIAAHPYYHADAVPAGEYRGVDEPVPTIGVGNIYVVRKDMQYRAVYEILKAVFENLDFLRKVHVAAELTKLETGAMSPIPLHPGAERFFRDRGIID
ncbi:TAXI family TRAP transporter solute-binding subunit [Dehalococcoidia bacterium]|nr:TAXI family TRAP transporter solute-binding subunit [Dehalococcoidia bacterium]